MALIGFRDPEAILADFDDLSRIGATKNGGVERQAASHADGQSRQWLAEWLTKRGFTVLNDQIGNQFGLYTFASGNPFVLAGSHLDSQPKGGKYDGAYGVLAAAHAAYRLVQHYQHIGQTPPFNIAVVNWFNEEGSRFKPSLVGSSVFCGFLDLTTALETKDTQGITAREALAAIDSLGDCPVLEIAKDVAAYAEIHIEQGPLLDKEGIDVGLVTSVWPTNKYELIVCGAQSHTGSTHA